MNTRLYFGIMVRLVLLFAVGMLFTYFPGYLREFFGDTIHVCGKQCVGPTSSSIGNWCSNRNDGTDAAWDWGIRHYWYFWLCIFMFILTLINFIMSVFRLISKHYPGSISDV